MIDPNGTDVVLYRDVLQKPGLYRAAGSTRAVSCGSYRKLQLQIW